MAIERCENDAMRSSFQPAAKTQRGGQGEGPWCLEWGRGVESAKPRKNKRRRGEYKKNSPKVHTAIKQNECDKARKEDGGEGGVKRVGGQGMTVGVVRSEMNQLSPPPTSRARVRLLARCRDVAFSTQTDGRVEKDERR